MAIFLQDTYAVLWSELRFLLRFWKRTLFSSLLGSLLYLLAFGYGLASSIDVVDGSNYLLFVIPGIIALTAMSGSYNGAGMKLHIDKIYYKSFDEVLMSPVSLGSVVIGKALSGVLRGSISAGAFIIIGLISAPEMIVNIYFILILLLSMLMFSFLGIMAALISNSHQDMITFGNVLILPMTFLGGTFFSLEQLPLLLKGLIYALPLTHSSQTLRAIALGQDFPWASLFFLSLFTLVFFAISFYRLRKISI
ncbi:MAG: ABC transporter permease [Chloroflexi bacterium]|nr:ABC transporter permease [Chloroflexota bacterium]